MVATTYMWVLDRKVVATRSIYTVEASNEDQALLMDIRKKDMTNNITIIMTFMMLEPLNWSPSVCETDFQLSGGDYQLSGCYYQLTGSDYQLTGSDYQLTSSYILTKIFTPRGANFSLMVGLHGKPSPAAARRCLWTAPPQLSRSHTSASVSEKRSHL